MKKLETHSVDNVKIINTLLANQRLAKLIYYPQKSPYEQPDIPDAVSTLLWSQVLPWMFDQNSETEDKVSLRGYMGRTTTDSSSQTNTRFIVDIFVPKTKEFHLMKEDGVHKLRPLEIQTEVVNTLDNKNIGIGFTLNLFEIIPYVTNNKFNHRSIIFNMIKVTGVK